jgi:hypothetical protein
MQINSLAFSGSNTAFTKKISCLEFIRNHTFTSNQYGLTNQVRRETKNPMLRYFWRQDVALALALNDFRKELGLPPKDYTKIINRKSASQKPIYIPAQLA